MAAFADDLPPGLEDDLPPGLEDDLPPGLEEDEDALPPGMEAGGGGGGGEKKVPDAGDEEKTEEKTMMDTMMELALAEKKKKDARRAAQRKKHDQTFGAGLAGGFFNQAKKKKKKKKKVKAAGDGTRSNSGETEDLEASEADEAEAEAAKKKKKREKKKKKKKALQAGFLNAGSSKPSRSVGGRGNGPEISFVEDDDDIIRFKEKPPTSADPLANLRMDDVQQAMKATMDNQSQWMTPELMMRMASNPKLAMGLANPRCMQAMQDFQTNPKMAQEKYKDDAMVNTFMTEFMGLMGDHMQKMGEKEARNKEINEKVAKEEALKKVKKEDPEVASALSNPEIMALLQDEEMKEVMKICSTQDGALRKYLRDPKIGPKLFKMRQYGLIQF
jgi:hypothetical protein